MGRRRGRGRRGRGRRVALLDDLGGPPREPPVDLEALEPEAPAPGDLDAIPGGRVPEPLAERLAE